MTVKRYGSSDDAMQFGFRWGPLDVVRLALFKGRYALAVRTDHAEVEIIVSPTGRNISVYQNGRKLS